MMSGFWRRWLTVWCWGVVLFGAVLAGAAFEASSGPVRVLFAVLGGLQNLELDGPQRFTIAIMGAVTLGWGLTLAVVVQAAHRLGAEARATWVGVTLSVLTWYVIDSVLSVATGFSMNAASNTVLLAGYLAPVLVSGVLRRSA